MAIGSIITADIVNSTQLSPGDLSRLREKLITEIQSHKFEFYRGDSFQIYVKDPAIALTLVIRLRLTAKKLNSINDIRSSIGIGEINPKLKIFSIATDEAFVFSGRSFDALKKEDRLLAITSNNEIANHGFNVISYFIDFLSRRFTEKQAEVFLVLLTGNTQGEAGSLLRKSRSTINKHVQSGGWHEISRLIKEYKAMIDKL